MADIHALSSLIPPIHRLSDDAEAEAPAPLSLPLLPPQPGDIVHTSLAVNTDGLVSVSLLAISSRIAQPVLDLSRPAPLSIPYSLVPSALANLPPPSTRIRVLGHSRSEAKDGSEYITYIVEYANANQQSYTSSSSSPSPRPSSPSSPSPSSPSSPSASSRPFVTTKRFSDFYALHRQLSLSFLCLPPFPSRTLLRSLSDAALIRDRELALTLYLQLIAQREDIRKTGDLERFLHIAEGQGMGAIDDRRGRERNDTERERDVDASMKIENAKAEQRRTEERRMEEACSQRLELLIDPYAVLHTKHIDIDAVKELTNKEQELRQTTFIRRPDDAPRVRPAPQPQPGPSPPSPSAATLGFLARSATLTVARALLPSPLLLFLIAGDSSKLGHLDAFITGLWTGWLDSRKQAERAERERSKPEVYHEEDHKPQPDEESEAEQPLGAFYAFSRASPQDQWQPTLSLWFERELVDAIWDAKRGWVYLLDDAGLLHVYSPQANDWSRVRKVWTIRLHSARIASARFSHALDALITLSVQGHVAIFDLASLSLSSAFAEPDRSDDAITRALGWGGRGSGLAHDGLGERVFIGGADGAIAVWDAGRIGVRQERLLGLMKGHEGLVKAIAYAEANEVLASGGVDGALLLWEVARDGAEERSRVRGRVEGHGTELTCVEFSDDGWWVLSGDAEGRVMVTSTESALPVFALQAHSKAITSLAMRDGLLVTASEDHSARVWLCH